MPTLGQSGVPSPLARMKFSSTAAVAVVMCSLVPLAGAAFCAKAAPEANTHRVTAAASDRRPGFARRLAGWRPRAGNDVSGILSPLLGRAQGFLRSIVLAG